MLEVLGRWTINGCLREVEVWSPGGGAVVGGDGALSMLFALHSIGKSKRPGRSLYGANAALLIPV